MSKKSTVTMKRVLPETNMEMPGLGKAPEVQVG